MESVKGAGGAAPRSGAPYTTGFAHTTGTGKGCFWQSGGPSNRRCVSRLSAGRRAGSPRRAGF